MKPHQTPKNIYVSSGDTLPLSVKVVAGIVLLALTIAITAATDPAVIQTISSLLYSEPVGKHRSDPENRLDNKLTATKYEVDIRDGSPRIEVTVDQYPFFGDEHDIGPVNNY